MAQPLHIPLLPEASTTGFKRERQPKNFQIQVHLGLRPPVPLHLSSASCRRGFSCVCAWCSLAGPITAWASPCHPPPPHIAPDWVYKPTSRRPRWQIQGTCLADCGGPGHAPAFRKRCGEPFFVPVGRQFQPPGLEMSMWLGQDFCIWGPMGNLR